MPDIIYRCKLVMFADDTKCYKALDKISDSVTLQEDLNALTSWSKRTNYIFCHLNVAIFVLVVNGVN